jgi:serine/threonine-protein kinase
MTDPGLWERATALFQRALEVAAADRAGFVAAEAGPDRALRDRVLAMLRSDARTNPLLDATPAELAETVTPDAIPLRLEGRRIGPYVVRRVLGQGGMGIVCLAEREDIGKQVALKLVAGGLGSPERVARFLRERRVLARLEHPNIAPLLDAGVADDGTPWFAMEYVAGEGLDRYCDRLRLSVDRRLELFERVCSAVGYAHQHLVVHRDLKPANILVSQDGEPRLVDFGIAKLLADSDDDQQTGTGMRVMTPGYASPEQRRGDPITTASDVYQLGAVLFELLTGRRLGPDTTGSAPTGRLARDLSVIVRKATDPDPPRRYHSAEQLALDVARHRRGLPIEARPATLAYRLGKLVTRHTVGTLVVAAGLLTVVGFAAALARQNRRVEAQRVQAEQVSDLLTDLFAGADPTVTQGDTVTVRAVLDRGLERARSGLTADPRVNARLLSVIGQAYYNLGELQRSVDVQAEVVAALRGRGRPDDPDWLEALSMLTSRLADAGERERAYPPGEEALVAARTLPPRRRAELAAVLRDLSFAHQRAGDDAGARRLAEEALPLFRSVPPPADGGIEPLLINLGFLAQNRGDFPGAAGYLREVVERRRARLGPDHLATANAVLNLGMVLEGSDLAEAETLIRDAVAVQRRVYAGGPHRDRLSGLTGLARVLGARGANTEAEATQREVLDIARTVYGDSSRAVAMAVANLAGYVQRQGRLDDAAELHAEAVRRLRDHDGAAAPAPAVAVTNLAYTEFLRGRTAEAEALYRGALPVLDSAWRGTPRIASILTDFGWVLQTRGRCREAEDPLRRALEMFRPRGAGDRDLIRTQRFLGGCLLDLGRYAAAESLLVVAHQSLLATFGDRNRYTLEAAGDLGRLYREWGRPAEAARFEAPSR